MTTPIKQNSPDEEIARDTIARLAHLFKRSYGLYDGEMADAMELVLAALCKSKAGQEEEERKESLGNEAPATDVNTGGAQGQKYRKRPVVITAQQFLEGEPIPKGVCFGWRCGADPSEPHVHTIHDNQRVDVVFGDWIIPEPDGEHYYPVKDDIFWRTYERAAPSVVAGVGEHAAGVSSHEHFRRTGEHEEHDGPPSPQVEQVSAVQGQWSVEFRPPIGAFGGYLIIPGVSEHWFPPADIDALRTIAAAHNASLKDAARLEYYFTYYGEQRKPILAMSLEALHRKPSLDEWRNAIDAAMSTPQASEARSGAGEVHGPTRPRIHSIKMLDAIEAVVLGHSGNEQLAENVRKWLSTEPLECVSEIIEIDGEGKVHDPLGQVPSGVPFRDPGPQASEVEEEKKT